YTIQRNGTKLFAVGTASSLIGTSAINALIIAKKAVGKSGEVENVPILSTSVGYCVYMIVSSNLRFDINIFLFVMYSMYGYLFLLMQQDNKFVDAELQYSGSTYAGEELQIQVKEYLDLRPTSHLSKSNHSWTSDS
ncbi:Protein RETICULATA-RELATED 4, chloroplastic, partial [Linum perenne]